jgi:ribosomal protein S19E (S16A)
MFTPGRHVEPTNRTMTSRILQEIRQSKPMALPVEAHLNIQRTAAALRALLEHETETVGGLKQVEYNVLRILRGAGEAGLLTDEVRDRMISPDAMLPAVLGSLANRGLIERREQRRAITADGLRILAQLDERIDSALGLRIGRLADDEVRTLIAMLERLRD